MGPGVETQPAGQGQEAGGDPGWDWLNVYGWADSWGRRPTWARMAAMGPCGVGTNLGGHPVTPCSLRWEWPLLLPVRGGRIEAWTTEKVL